MCYSAQIEAGYKRYMREFGATINLREFYDLFWRRLADPKVKIPKAVEAAFASPAAEAAATGSDTLQQIKALIDEFAAAQGVKLQQDLFKQRTRLADAARTLAVKPTKKAAEDQRIAGASIDKLMTRLFDLQRADLTAEDARIFPQSYCPVLIMEGGRRVVRLMRYQCRPAGTPADYDRRFPGTYNARRDNLGGFWKRLFGHSHGVVLATSFFENVPRHKVEGRALMPGEAAQNVVLEFAPRPRQEMLVACLWSRWTASGAGASGAAAPGEPDLLSFAAITDDPPPEIALAGHDRCVIPIRPEHLEAWLNPDPRDLVAQYAILADRQPVSYEYREAA